MEKILILGGGISGLTLAYHLQKKHPNITLLEGSNRLGGWIQTDTSQGFLFEKGPRSLRMAGSGQTTLALAKELGLDKEIILAQGRTRYLWTSGTLRKLPSNPFQMLTSPLTRSLIPALLRERKILPTTLDDETIASFFTRRYNQTVLERFVDPLVTGIFAGSCSELSMAACFPHLWEMEGIQGSLFRGMRKKKKGNHNLFSFNQGMETLPRRLAERLEIEVKLNHPITKITRHRDHVEVEGGETTFTASHVYSALPPTVLSQLTDIPPVECRSIGVVSLGYHNHILNREGFGYLIPSTEEETILGAVWDSSVFPQQNGRPQETRITVMMREPNLEVAQEALARHLGILAQPDVTSIFFAKGAIPQYTLGHRERTEEARKALAPHIIPLGSGYYGVSVNDCIFNSLEQ